MKHYKILREVALLNKRASKEQVDAYYNALKTAYKTMTPKQREGFIAKTILVINNFKNEKGISQGRRPSNWREVIARNRD